jgi:uncharacterized protein
MNNTYILDTGPLVANIDRKDKDHQWIESIWRRIQPPLYTCEAVISEACFLLQSYPRGVEAVMDFARRGIVRIEFQLQDHVESIAILLKKYANVPMSLADACLVRMAEAIPGSSVLTLDSDFRIYRKSNRTVIPTIMPGK